MSSKMFPFVKGIKHIFKPTPYEDHTLISDTSYATSIPLYDVDRSFNGNYYYDPFAKSPVVTVKVDPTHLAASAKPVPTLEELDLSLPRPAFLQHTNSDVSPQSLQVDAGVPSLPYPMASVPGSYTLYVSRRDRTHTQSGAGAAPNLSPTTTSTFPETPIVTPVKNASRFAPSTLDHLRSITDTIRSRRDIAPTMPNKSEFLQTPQIVVNDAKTTENSSQQAGKDLGDFGWLLDYIGDGVNTPCPFPSSSQSSKGSHIDPSRVKAMEIFYRTTRQTLLQAEFEGKLNLNDPRLTESPDVNVVDKLQELFDFFQQDGLLPDTQSTYVNVDTNSRLIDDSTFKLNPARYKLPSSYDTNPDVPVSSTNTMCMPGTVSSQMKKAYQGIGYTDTFFMKRIPLMNGGDGKDQVEHVEDMSFSPEEADITANSTMGTSDISPLLPHSTDLSPMRRPRPPVPLRSIRLSRWPTTVDPKYIGQPSEWKPVKMEIAPSHGLDGGFATRDFNIELGKSARRSNSTEKRAKGPIVYFVLGFVFPLFWIMGGWYCKPKPKCQHTPMPRPQSRSSIPTPSMDFETGISFSFLPLPTDDPDTVSNAGTTNTTGLWYTHSDPMIKANRAAALVGIPSVFLLGMMFAILFTVVS